MPDKQRGWTTEDELAFIESLGARVHTGLFGPDVAWRDRHRALLDGYRAGIERRVVWGDIDRERVNRACE